MSEKIVTISTKLQIIAFASLLLFIVPTDYAFSIGTTINESTKKNLTNTTTVSNDPNIAISGNNIYVAYVDTDTGTDTDVYFILSTDSGATFGTPYIIDSGDTLDEAVVTSSANKGSVEIAVSGNNVYVVWEENDPDDTDTDVYIAVNTNSGANGSWTITSLSGPIEKGTITLASAVATDTVTINGLVYTAVAGSKGGDNTKFSIDTSNTAAATDLADSIANDVRTGITVPALDVTATSSGAIVIVEEITGNGNIDLASSNGVRLSVSGALLTGGPSTTPKLSVSGANVYVVWRDDSGAETNIYLNRSDDSGSTFKGVTKLTTATGSNKPQVTSTGDSVYVVWEENANPNFRVSFKGSIDKGATFPAGVQLLSTGTNNDVDALEIAVTGSTVHTIWRENTPDDLFYRGITDNANGTFTLSSIITVRDGSTTISEAIIVATSSTIHVAWRESDGSIIQIFYSRSTDNGATFSTRLDISGEAVTSRDPHIEITGENLYISWRISEGDGSRNIYVKTSIDDGVTFGGKKTVQDHSNDANFQKLASDSGTVYFVWEDDDDNSGANPDIFFVSGTTTDTDIVFDASNYRLSETATIDVTRAASNTDNAVQETITVTVTSDATGSTAISYTATETTVSSGVFRGTITFSESSSNDSTDTIKAIPGTKVTASFNSQTSTATIFSRIVNILATQYNLDGLVRIEVTDQNSNIDSSTAETINITVTSSNAPTSSSNPVTLLLTETGVNTGVFGGVTDAQLRFMNGFDAIPIKGQILITQDDATKDTTSDPDTTTVTVTTDTEPSGTTITLTETGGSTDVFTGLVQFTTGSTSDQTKKAAPGDYFTISGTFDLKGQIAGGSDNSKKAIRTNVAQGSPDTITATFGASSDTASVTFLGGEGGGGGGGSVRPTIVLNAILGIGGSSIDITPPLSSLDKISERKDINIPDHIKEILSEFDPKIPISPLVNEEFDLPLKINQNAYPLGSNENTIQTETINIGEPVRFEMVFYEDSELEHVSIYLNIRDNQRADQSDTQILFNRDKPLEIIDKNSFFENVSVEIIETEDGIKIAVFEITFAKEMETSDLIYKSWDFKRMGTEIMVHNAIQITPIIEDIPTEEPTTEETVETTEKKPVPDWVKSNAKWWAEGGIDDKTFTNGIGFLISEKIIDIPVEANVSKDKDEESFEEEETVKIKVPKWVKAIAEWWADDQIDEDTFLSGIEYLVRNGIIIVA